jgi:acetylornithine/N-succinyldiaminopimelate aminotransferase
VTSSLLMNTYKRTVVDFVRGDGEYLFDSSGKRYIDMLAGVAVVSVGHSNLHVAEAIATQAHTLVHVSNYFGTIPMRELADRLHSTAGGWGRVFFCNSGAEANECAIKLVRKSGGGKKFKILASEGGFHGRTMGALAATGQPEKWRGFEPLLEGFTHRPYNDLEAFAAALDDSFAAILVEPIQGERGVIPATHAFLSGIRDLCTRANIPLILDEVQTGIGRTGHWWAFQHYGVKPDIMTSAKGIANGLPLGACIADEPYASVFSPGDHGTTFGGGPLVCAAAVATFEEIEQRGLLPEITRKGNLLAELLSSIDGIHDVRGVGLMRGAVLEQPIAMKVVAKALELGLVGNATSDSVLRFVPPLVISDLAIHEGVEILRAAFASVKGAVGLPSETVGERPLG